MARTDSDAVALILMDYDSSISLDPFIEAANFLVTENCADDSDYTTAQLELIERWLAGHFYRQRERPIFSRRAGQVSQTFSNMIGLFLQNTHEGQMAMMFDTNGHLAALSKAMEKGKKRVVSISWGGKESALGEGDDDTT